MPVEQIIISSIFGALGIAANVFIYQQKNGKNLLKVKLLSDAIWAIHYLSLFAYSAVCTCCIAIVRESIFLHKEKRWAQSKLWLVLFIACNIVSAILTWKSIWSILPGLAGVISVVSFWIAKPKVTRTLAYPISALFLTYAITVESIPGIANELFTLTSTTIANVREHIQRKKDAQ